MRSVEPPPVKAVEPTKPRPVTGTGTPTLTPSTYTAPTATLADDRARPTEMVEPPASATVSIGVTPSATATAIVLETIAPSSTPAGAVQLTVTATATPYGAPSETAATEKLTGPEATIPPELTSESERAPRATLVSTDSKPPQPTERATARVDSRAVSTDIISRTPTADFPQIQDATSTSTIEEDSRLPSSATVTATRSTISTVMSPTATERAESPPSTTASATTPADEITAAAPDPEQTARPDALTGIPTESLEATSTEALIDRTEPTQTQTGTQPLLRTPTATDSDTITDRPAATEVSDGTVTATDSATQLVTRTAPPTQPPIIVASPAPSAEHTATVDTVTETSIAIVTSASVYTPTSTQLPSHTATAGATPSSSQTPSDTPTVTPTQTPLPFYIAYLIPTPTVFGSFEDALQSDCEIEETWLPYAVQEGDTLLSTAIASGSSLIELRDGNCYEPYRGILFGETLLLPKLPASPVKAYDPVFPRDDAMISVVGCGDWSAMIHAPQAMTNLEGIFGLIGSTSVPDGGSYRIAVKPVWSDDYHLYLASDQSVRGDVIGLINTEIFGSGLHHIQLTVVDRDGELAGGLCEIPLVFSGPQDSRVNRTES